MKRDIPDTIKRELRQEAGFGCCICGNPVYEYHHIKPFSDEQSHDPAQMMILCPNHHYAATIGAITEAEQKHFKEKPANINNGFVNGLLYITDPAVAIRTGTNYLVGLGIKIVIDGKPMLTLEKDAEGRLLLSIDLYDRNDSLILSIHRNEWIAADPIPWDIEFQYRTLKIRIGKGNTPLAIDARNTPILLSGELWWHQQCIALGRRGMLFNGVLQNAGIANLGLVGNIVSVDTQKKGFTLIPDPRYVSARIVSWPDPFGRLIRCFNALAEMEAEIKK